MSQVLDLTKALIARPSITPEDKGCQALLIERLQRMGFTIKDFSLGAVKNFWAQRGQGNPRFCFAGHTDVVPPGQTQWITPAFTPTVHDGFLYGRGAADMKGSLAAMVVACEQFLADHPNHKGTLAFLITSDEEGPAIQGTQAVLEKLADFERPQWCLVGEPSSQKQVGDTLKIGRRGSLTGHLNILGKQGHVAYPQHAQNAIHQGLRACKALFEHDWGKAIPPFPATTLQFVHMQAGVASNVIPGELKAQFNLRFSPHLGERAIQKAIEEILVAHHCHYTLKWQCTAKPFYTEPDCPFIQKVAMAVKKITTHLPQFSTDGGTSDGRFFAKHGIDVVELGPVNATIHQVNECIEIEALTKLCAMYQAILTALLT